MHGRTSWWRRSRREESFKVCNLHGSKVRIERVVIHLVRTSRCPVDSFPDTSFINVVLKETPALKQKRWNKTNGAFSRHRLLTCQSSESTGVTIDDGSERAAELRNQLTWIKWGHGLCYRFHLHFSCSDRSKGPLWKVFTGESIRHSVSTATHTNTHTTRSLIRRKKDKHLCGRAMTSTSHYLFYLRICP